MRLQRAALLVVAVLAIAWLGVSYGNARKIRHAELVAGNPHATPAQLESALADVRSAGALDPSTGAELLSYEAALELRGRHFPQGLELLEKVVQREPDSADAWFLIAELTRASDPARSAEAQAEVHRLDPLAAQAAR